MAHSGSLAEPRGIIRVGLRWLSLQHQSFFSGASETGCLHFFMETQEKKREEEEDRKVLVERQGERRR